MELTVSGVPSRGAVAHTGGLDNGRFGSHAACVCVRVYVCVDVTRQNSTCFSTHGSPRGVGRCELRILIPRNI